MDEVRQRTQGEFTPSGLSAYERGERPITVARLLRLAEVYGVEPQTLLPPTPRASPDPVGELTLDAGGGRLVLQLGTSSLAVSGPEVVGLAHALGVRPGAAVRVTVPGVEP